MLRVNDDTVVATPSVPDRMFMKAPGLTTNDCKQLAYAVVLTARPMIPKLSGRAAQGLKPVWGAGWFGVKWDQPYLWYQEAGIRPFTMTKLAGKVIPMWIDDPTGEEHRKNPKAKQRTTVSGRRQVLIFRRAAKPGERKRTPIRNAQGGITGYKSVPKSYPGAPGRIAYRRYSPTTPSGSTGKIAQRNVGVRWRHPGLTGRGMVQHALQSVAADAGMREKTVYATYGRG